MMKHLFLLLLLLFLGTNFSNACICTPYSFEEETARAERIFVGKVVENQNGKFIFKVIKEWTPRIQESTDTAIVTQFRTSCEKKSFLEGKIYLIYRIDGAVKNCSNSLLFSRVRGDIERLDGLTSWKTKLYHQDEIDYNQLNYERKYVLETNQGQINIEGKKVLYIFDKKIIGGNEEIPVPDIPFYLITDFNIKEIDFILLIDFSIEERTVPPKLKRKVRRKLGKMQ